MKAEGPLIFDIARHALHDGPGIRTTIFFKGCPLQCLWCHNPESIDPGPEIGFYPSECIRCGECVAACPTGAAQIDLPGRIDREECKRCGACAEACPGRGLRQIGRFYEIDELVDIVLRDKVYYQTSGGGVTLSGGEPTLFMNYASHLLQQLKSNGVHIALQTCGFFGWDEFKSKMLCWLDLILFDVKLADADLHRNYTGKPNAVILENLSHLVQERPADVVPRIPLIPGVTTEPDNLQQINKLFGQMGINHCWLLPYNSLGFSKQETIGKPSTALPKRLLTEDEIERIREFFPGVGFIEM